MLLKQHEKHEVCSREKTIYYKLVMVHSVAVYAENLFSPLRGHFEN